MVSKRPPGYRRFVTKVSRFRPSSLLPLIAEFTARHDPNNGVEPDHMRRAPWAFSAMARESLLHGSETGESNATRQTVQRLYALFMSTYDAAPRLGLSSLIGPLAYEQFPYQEAHYADLARVQAMLIDPIGGPKIAWDEEFGVSLSDALTGSMILHTWVGLNDGRYDPALLATPEMQEIFAKVLPRPQLEVLVKSMTTTVSEARASVDRVPMLPSALRRYGFNPLAQTPLVDLGGGGIVAPQTLLVPRVISTGNLYYRGAERWGSKFTNDLGQLVEAYVGVQLRSLDYGTVLAEISYGKPQRKSVDWIWITPGAVVLIESKSGRMLLNEKAGAADPSVSVERYLRTARKQIDESALQILTRHDAFRQIPVDRPVIGLTVTAEAFYLGNAVLPEYETHGSTRAYVVSLREFERLLQNEPHDIVATLLKVAGSSGGGPWTLADLTKDLPRKDHNTVLAGAWTRMHAWRKQSALGMEVV
jgi:hypothetical protein